ncbi:potassium channel family protein [Noviherbaspirillum sp. CPCC 100848]|uniref:Potassium channel family protein n=1 Tax=Noviherbaspirillum album TaxID=3080276 RepID=A0ABU6JI91_9BURK|nr:potassium channel family protein [Noviherbaspirillum sp. CPCC 100848]MEC4723413.1 potassium channel family protein [Noviherbaspirillum sp. CPCC 100848]
MIKKSHPLFWILSPTYKLAEIVKSELLSQNDGKTKLTAGIKKFNETYFWTTVLFAGAIGFLFKQEYYGHELNRFINYVVCVPLGLFFFSRAFEILKAFLDDAVDKLNHGPSASALGYGDRLVLAFRSYLELLVGFGVFYYILPAWLFKYGESTTQFTNIIQAIYFSGVTITTVGYGDISPTHWFTQFLIVFQVFCGLTLALVSFTVYTGLALATSKPSSDEKSDDNR